MSTSRIIRSLVVAATIVGLAGASAPPAAPSSSTPRWSWPVQGYSPVIRPFLVPETPYSAGHRGIDLDARSGAVVIAPFVGTVSFAGHVVDRDIVSLSHDGDLVSSFEPVTAVVSVGDQVTTGQPIGTVAAGAHCDSLCLHVGVRLHGEYISPLALIQGIPRAVLLPLQPLQPLRREGGP
ncbi:murein hydrolase activator EnvC family protein [Glaciibacter psychrotolerans]|uniref:Murein DD-endopeptidase MepM/ murein hydrolase activator NlpD n=1 Tax=Glaciibacter psychrotolerans TaxID=670054 RepID=A0A7Z0ED42_9MICO|nr:peptidoglycan DD-metalloendopeptidase family protein [Leifsonia psychrotolerans]NYJ19437.1 murein DD-endopeptidase MepM/ murein hydrolase activator NlpD [Leifsonia psychrotolerans]